MNTKFSRLTGSDKAIMIFAYTILGLFMAAIILPVNLHHSGILHRSRNPAIPSGGNCHGVYVTCPDDAQYRPDWIKDIYTPDMNHKYVYPNVFMSTEDTKKISDLSADISKCINTAKADWVMNGFTDADWDKLQSDLDAYGLKDYLAIFQKYLDTYYA